MSKYFERKIFELDTSITHVSKNICSFVNYINKIDKYTYDTADKINDQKRILAESVIKFIIECYCIFIYETNDDNEYNERLNELINDGILDIDNLLIDNIYKFSDVIDNENIAVDYFNYINDIIQNLHDILNTKTYHMSIREISADVFDDINDDECDLFLVIFDCSTYIDLPNNISFPDLTVDYLNFNDHSIKEFARNKNSLKRNSICFDLTNLHITFTMYYISYDPEDCCKHYCEIEPNYIKYTIFSEPLDEWDELD